MAKKTTGDRPDLKTVNASAAAIDIGSTMHMAAVNSDSTDEPIRAFGTFTHDLHDLADWFSICGVTSVAMESTGVYWMPAYEILEQHGFEVILVNARYAKNAPRRKTDVSDAEWLRQLHSFGLLRIDRQVGAGTDFRGGETGFRFKRCPVKCQRPVMVGEAEHSPVIAGQPPAPGQGRCTAIEMGLQGLGKLFCDVSVSLNYPAEYLTLLASIK